VRCDLGNRRLLWVSECLVGGGGCPATPFLIYLVAGWQGDEWATLLAACSRPTEALRPVSLVAASEPIPQSHCKESGSFRDSYSTL
jgi:hypothetical protein